MSKNRIEAFLSPNKVLNDNLHLFIESFIQYYGEDKRQEIENIFSKTHFFCYQDPSSIQSKLTALDEEITKDLLKTLEIDKELELENTDIYSHISNFRYANIMPIYAFNTLLEEASLEPEDRKKRFIEKGYKTISSYIKELTMDEYAEMYSKKVILPKYQNYNPLILSSIEYYIDESNINDDYDKAYRDTEVLLEKIDSGVTKNNFKEKLSSPKFQKLKLLTESFMEKYEEYKRIKDSYSEYYKYAQFVDSLERSLEKKYYEQYVLESKDLLSDAEREILNNENTLHAVLGKTLRLEGVFDSFSKEADEKLANSKSEFIRNDIIKNRIKYFNIRGINLGNDYESYLNNEEVKRIWPKREVVEKIIEIREECLDSKLEEYYLNNPQFQEMREKVDKLNLLDKESDICGACLYLSTPTCVAPNIIQTDKGYELIPLVYIDFSHINTQEKEHDIVHEMNHVLELHLEEAKNNEYSLLCGWDEYCGTFDNQSIEVEIKTEKRKYELFNEIINELIIQDICDIHRQNNNPFVFDDKDHCDIRHTTGYEKVKFIVEEFYKKYKKEIIESRHNGNIQIIYDAVGKENFEELNDMVNSFNEEYDGRKYYQLLDSLNSEENEMKKEYYNILSKRDLILKNMESHYQNNNSIKIEVI